MMKHRNDDEVYGELPLHITRPKNDLSRPCNRREFLFCWRFWILKILNPRETREVLDNLDSIPSFNASWSSRRKITKLQPKNKHKTRKSMRLYK